MRSHTSRLFIVLEVRLTCVFVRPTKEMDANKQQRGVIRFLIAEGVRGQEFIVAYLL